jgi:hypothetical protein
LKTKADYLEYLQSEHWLELHQRVIERDGGKCTRCPSRVRLQAHHLFYRARWEDSLLSDLVTLCRPCHEKEHGLPPSPEPQSDYVRQIFTLDQLRRARELDFISQKVYDGLLPKFQPAALVKISKPSTPSTKVKRRKKWLKKWRQNVRCGRWSC